MKKTASLFAGAMLLAGILPASADEQLSGTILDGSNYVRVALTLPSATPSAPAGDLRVAGSWACNLTLNFVTTDEQKVDFYALGGPAKGRCAPLENGYLHRRGAGGAVVIELFKRGEESPLYTVKLDPPGK